MGQLFPGIHPQQKIQPQFFQSGKSVLEQLAFKNRLCTNALQVLHEYHLDVHKIHLISEHINIVREE